MCESVCMDVNNQMPCIIKLRICNYILIIQRCQNTQNDEEDVNQKDESLHPSALDLQELSSKGRKALVSVKELGRLVSVSDEALH